MFFRKSFDADAEGQTGASSGNMADIVSLMATKGVMNETAEQVATPIDIAEAVVKPNTEVAEGAVAATEEPTEVATPTPQTAAETPTETKTEVVPQSALVELSWQEVLKKQKPQSDTILKELGFDDKVVGFLNHWKNNGDVTAYLKELTTDYTKMPAEEVMMHQLRLEYPNLSERHLEVLYEEEVLNKYKLTDDFSETEQERGRLLLEAKTEKYRKDLVNNQQNFLIPAPPEPTSTVEEPQGEATNKVLQRNLESVVNSPFYKQVLSKNTLTIGEGDEAFSFPVDAAELPSIIYDPIKFVENMFTVTKGADGEINLEADPEKQMLVAAVAKHGKQFLIEYAKHYKSIGSKKAIDPIENPSRPNKSAPAKSDAPPKTAAEAMARNGRLSWA
jgi:hypothetical protein